MQDSPLIIGSRSFQSRLLVGTGKYKDLQETHLAIQVAQELESMGCVAIMPLGSLIGSGLGILNPHTISIIKENAKVPVLVDAGVGTASDAAIAMELGCDGVLMNTAIAVAQQPILMASAMKKAVEAGREAFLAGRMPRKRMANASSPETGYFFK